MSEPIRVLHLIDSLRYGGAETLLFELTSRLEAHGFRPSVFYCEPGPLVEDPSFELRATASGPYSVGDRGTFDILLTPRGNYHVNEDYPMTVTLAGPEAVMWPRSELGNEDARERTRARARFDVPFTASSAGQHRVTANVDFAVCTPETCMPEQRTLAVLLPVE